MKRVWPWIGVVALILIAYGLCVRNQFVYEDTVYDITFRWTRAAVWEMFTRPNRYLSFAFFTARHVVIAHAENVVIHLAVALTAGWLAQRLGMKGWIFAGLVGLHPIMSQGVLYAYERMEAMTALGILLACVGVTMRDRKGLALLVFGAWFAMASKQSGVIVVGIVPLIWWLEWDAYLRPRRWLLAVGALATTVAVRGLVNLFWVNHTVGAGVSAGKWAAQMTTGVLRLVWHYAWPVAFSIEHPTPDAALVLLSGAVLALLTISFVLQAFVLNDPFILAGVGIFWMGVLLRFVLRLELSFFPEHQWYVPAIGLSLIAAAYLDRVRERWTWAVFVVLTVLSLHQTLLWHDNLSVWTHAVAVEPCSSRAHINRAYALEQAGDAAEGVHERILTMAAASFSACTASLSPAVPFPQLFLPVIR